MGIFIKHRPLYSGILFKQSAFNKESQQLAKQADQRTPGTFGSTSFQYVAQRHKLFHSVGNLTQILMVVGKKMYGQCHLFIPSCFLVQKTEFPILESRKLRQLFLIQRVFVEYISLDCCVSQATISQIGCQTVTSTEFLHRQKF